MNHEFGRNHSLKASVEELLQATLGRPRSVAEIIGAITVGFGALATTHHRYALTLIGPGNYTNSERRSYLGCYLALGADFQPGAEALSTAVA